MMVKPIRKGHDFERQIARLLTERTGHKFQRVPYSGMHGTVHGTDLKGDVYTQEQCLYKGVLIECKARKTLSWQSIFTYTSVLWTWIKRLSRPGAGWMLFIKLDSTGIYAISSHPSYLDRLFGPGDVELIINGQYYMIKVR